MDIFGMDFIFLLRMCRSWGSVGILCDRAHPLFGTLPLTATCCVTLRGIAPFSSIYILWTYFVVPIGYHQIGLTPVVPAVTHGISNSTNKAVIQMLISISK